MPCNLRNEGFKCDAKRSFRMRWMMWWAVRHCPSGKADAVGRAAAEAAAEAAEAKAEAAVAKEVAAEAEENAAASARAARLAEEKILNLTAGPARFRSPRYRIPSN